MKTPEVGDIIQNKSTGVYFRVERFSKPEIEILVDLKPLDEREHLEATRGINTIRFRFIPFSETVQYRGMLCWVGWCAWVIFFPSAILNKPTTLGIVLGLLGGGLIYLTHLLLLKLYTKGWLDSRKLRRKE